MRRMSTDVAPTGITVLDRCSCLAGRRAARAISQLYDHAMAAAQVTNGQFTLLAQIAIRPPSTVSVIASRLLFERTTLTRNLQLMHERGMVAFDAGEDQRQSFVRLTRSGESTLIEALPLWFDVQERLRTVLGTDGWERALSSLQRMAAGITSDRTVSRPQVRHPPPRSPSNSETTLLVDRQLALLRSNLCMASTLRRTNRAVTRRYDRSLRDVGLKTSQFHLLAAVDSHAGFRLGQFVDVLTLEQSTLTRLFHHFLKVGLCTRFSDGMQKRGFILAEPGLQLLHDGLACWSEVQRASALSIVDNDIDFNAEMSRVVEAADRARWGVRETSLGRAATTPATAMPNEGSP